MSPHTLITPLFTWCALVFLMGHARDAGAQITCEGQVDGGTIAGNGQSTLYFCPSIPNDGFVRFTSTTTLGDSNYVYAITTATSQPVVISLLNGDNFDFATVSLNAVRVYAYSFTGTSRVVVGYPITIEPLSDSCFALSENFVTIINEEPQAGSITTDRGTEVDTVRVDEEVPPPVRRFTTTSDSLTDYRLVLTDTNDIVLELPLGDSITFPGAAAGAVRVWGIAFTGPFRLAPGDTLMAYSPTDACVDLSENFVAIERIPSDTGTVGTGNGLNFTALRLQLSASPNPLLSDNLVRLSLIGKAPVGNAQLLIYDASGRLCHRQALKFGVGQEAITVDLTGAGPGIYTAVYATSAGRVFTRFIKP